MSEVDLVILACIGFSAAASFFRGMFREAMSLAVWLAAVLITLYYSSRVATLLPIDSVTSPLARASISAVVLFTGTLFVGVLAKWFTGHILAGSKMGIADRAGGAVFGMVRGVVVVTLMILAANLAPELKQEQWWQRSALVPHFQNMASIVHRRLPDTIGQHFDLSQNGY